MKLNRLVLVVLAVLMITSCKVRVIVPEGGHVEDQYGGVCNAGRTCIMDVVDFYFDYTITAKPAEGYKFKFWKKGDRRFCGGKDRTKPCRIATTPFTGAWVPVIQPFLEDPDEVFYLEPVFERVSATPLQVAGSWAGTATDSSGPGQISWVITQSGTSFSGTVKVIDTGSGIRMTGTVSGTVSGSTLSFGISVPPGGINDVRWAHCSVSMTGTASVSGSSLSGNYSGTNSCSGGVSYGTLTLRKQ